MTDKEAIEIAQKLKELCSAHSGCKGCPFVRKSSEDWGDVCRLTEDIPSEWLLNFTGSDKKDEQPKKMKRVPFDLNLKEDRDALRGRWIKWKEYDDEKQITGFDKYPKYWAVQNVDSSVLFEECVFLDGEDAGEPVGKLVEVVEE